MLRLPLTILMQAVQMSERWQGLLKVAIYLTVIPAEAYMPKHQQAVLLVRFI